jgi:hypothetical protein
MQVIRRWQAFLHITISIISFGYLSYAIVSSLLFFSIENAVLSSVILLGVVVFTIIEIKNDAYSSALVDPPEGREPAETSN